MSATRSVGAVDVRAAGLVQGGHPRGRGVLPGRPLGGLTQAPGHLLGHVLAHQVVGVGSHPPGVLEAAR